MADLRSTKINNLSLKLSAQRVIFVILFIILEKLGALKYERVKIKE
jgi:hypothetical protein